jgi:hypothetical protein
MAIGSKLVLRGPSKARLLGERAGVTIRFWLGMRSAKSLPSSATSPGSAQRFFISEA